MKENSLNFWQRISIFKREWQTKRFTFFIKLARKRLSNSAPWCIESLNMNAVYIVCNFLLNEDGSKEE